MTATPRTRWTLYAVAALATVAAIWWPGASQDSETVQPVQRSALARTELAGADGAGTASTLTAARPRATVLPLSDPFAVQGGTAQSGDAIAAKARADDALMRTPTAPALPFAYLGTWKERGKTFVFLQRGDRSYKVDGPGALDADYAVQAIDDVRITLKYLPLGIVQDLRLDAPARAPQNVAAPSTDTDGELQVGN